MSVEGVEYCICTGYDISQQFNNEHFKYLEAFFPARFLSRSSSIEDLSVAVEVRTQHLIMLLTRYSDVPNFDPDLTLLQQTLYVAEGNSAPTLKGWNSRGFSALLACGKVDEWRLERCWRWCI